MEIVVGLLSVATALLDAQASLVEASNERKELAAKYFEDVGKTLLDAWRELKAGQQPHGACGQMAAFAEHLPEVVGRELGSDKALELSNKLKSAHEVENLYNQVVGMPDAEKKLAELQNSGGMFLALASIMRASVSNVTPSRKGVRDLVKSVAESPDKKSTLAIATAIVALIVQAISPVVSFKNLRMTQMEKVLPNFQRAVKDLSDKNLSTKIGAVLSLEQLGYDSWENKQTIIELLAWYVRQNGSLANQANEKVVRSDVLAAVSAIGRLKQIPGQGNLPYDNSWNTITEAFISVEHMFYHVRPIRIDFRGINFRHAFLPTLNLEGADFSGSALEDANFASTHLEDALFLNANVARANFSYAYLAGAHFSGPYQGDAQYCAALVNKTTFDPVFHPDINCKPTFNEVPQPQPKFKQLLKKQLTQPEISKAASN